MTGLIVPREYIRNKARKAFFANQSRDSHGMNESAALTDWLDEYDTLAAAASDLAHSALMGGRRVDRSQAVQGSEARP